MMEEKCSKIHENRFTRGIERYQLMYEVKDQLLYRFTAKITFRFGFFSIIELTNSGLYLIY
jgi:hypothetical protein